jgi:hypothetical protein
LHHIINGHPLARDRQRSGRAYVSALEAQIAKTSIQLPGRFIDDDGVHRAYLLATAAPGAPQVIHYKLRVLVPGLGIRAPAAAEKASLEEDDGPDAGTIMDTEPLDVEYQSQLR